MVKTAIYAKDLSIPEETVMNKILLIRGKKVMLDKDLAELYGVETRRLKEQVKRNVERFPQHFMFELTKQENEILRSQFATLSHVNILSIYLLLLRSMEY